MIDCRRLILNLVFFFLGLLIPLFWVASYGFAACIPGQIVSAATNDFTLVSGIVYTNGVVVSIDGVDNFCGRWMLSAGAEIQFVGCKALSASQLEYSWVATGRESNLNKTWWTFEGTCPEDTEPAECDNGILDNGEDGVDCGGDCSADCVSLQKCASDEKVETVVNVGTGEISYSCSKTVATDSNSQCPSGFTRTTADNLVDGQWVTTTECYKEIGPAVEFTGSESLADAWDADPANVPASTSDGWSKKSLSVVKMNGGETVVDNGDGTETASFSWSKTDDKGNTTNGSASVNRPAGSAAGTGFGSGGDGGPGIAPGYVGQIQEDQEKDPEETPGNYAFGDGTVASGELDDGVPGRVGAVFSGFVDSVKAAPVYAAFSSLTSVPTSTNSVSGLSLGSWGAVDIDFSLFQSAFASLGWVLVGLALWRSYKLIVANK